MNAATALSPVLDGYGIECASLRAHRHNVLIEGPVADTHAVLLRLQPHLGSPIVWKLRHERLELSTSAASTLILEDIANLTTRDQAQLLAHLDGRQSHSQIVSTTERPLFPLVARGLFHPVLYYRLNVVLLLV